MQRGYLHEDTGGLFVGVSDEDLAESAAKKYPHAFSELLNRYTKLMLYKISCVKPVGCEADDFMQECSLALLDAVSSYSNDGRASFETYACVCIDNRLRSVLRKSKRDKNKPLNDYVEISDYIRLTDESGEVSTGTDPEEQLLVSESAAELRHQLSELLSAFELKVFRLYLEGRSYEDISKLLGVAQKKVDNALQRVRRKLKSGLMQSEHQTGRNGN